MAQSKAKDDRAKMMIYPNWMDMLLAAPPEYCQKLLAVLWQYRNGTQYEDLDLDPITATLFAGMKVQLDLDMQNYADTKARNQENGKKHTSGAKATDSNPEQPNADEQNPDVTETNPVGSSGLPNYPKATQSGGDKDNDKDKGKGKDLVSNTPLTPQGGNTADAADPETPVPSDPHKPKQRRRFVKPTAEEVAVYAAERGEPTFDAQYFFDHYEANGWKVGPNAMKDWRATVRQWIARNKKPGGYQAAERARRRQTDIYHDYSQEIAEIEAEDRANGWPYRNAGNPDAEAAGAGG